MKRKTLLFLVVVLGLGLQTTFGQVEKDVSQIRSDVLRTSKMLSTYKKTTKFVDGISLEGTEATFYSSKRGVKKIHAEIFGETYNSKADYYYTDDGKLIFVFFQFNRYDTQIGQNPPPKVVRTEEKRLYFKDGKMIKRIVTLTETSIHEESIESDKEILYLEKKFREAMKN